MDRRPDQIGQGCYGETRGRFVQIRNADEGQLCIGELEIIGLNKDKKGSTRSGFVNLALNKITKQSSKINGEESQKAIDGFLGPHSTACTMDQVRPWIEVNLRDIYKLEYLQIWNLSDGNGAPLDNFYVIVSEQPIPRISLEKILGRQKRSQLSLPGLIILGLGFLFLIFGARSRIKSISYSLWQKDEIKPPI